MRQLPLGTILKATLIAGLVAGLTAALFHLVVTEPVIERAIALESEMHGAGEADAAPLVSREVQRVGLVVGFLIYGLTWGLLLGLAYHLIQTRFADGSTRGRWLLALAGYWALGLFPFLKYPANPPGVGDPESIAYRQGLYLGLLVLSVGGVALAAAIARFGAPDSRARRLPALAFLAIFCAVVYAVMPANPDEVRMPGEVVANFRALSLVGLTLFWAVLGLLFGKLLRGPGVGRAVTRPSTVGG